MPSEVSTVGDNHAVEELRRELAEAREQQAATAEILRVISSSPMNLQRVFDEMAASAARLCDAYDAVIRQVNGDVLRLVAHHGPIATTEMVPLVRGHIQGRAVLDRQTIHLGDLQSQTEYPESRDRARSLGFRAALAVPLIPAGDAIGVIIIRRIEARPFTNRQIDLLKTFADQAVIAIENTRLFEAEKASKYELQESLEYQTATAEVLNVISRSPTELQPVLDAIAKTARHLCQAERATVMRLKEGKFHLAAWDGPHNPAHWKHLYEHPIAIEPGSMAGRVALEKRTVHLHDVRSDPSYTRTWEGIDDRRTMLGVPLMRLGAVTGVIVLTRAEVRPFTTKQIELVSTFADQAVIAIVNTRLFEEVQARTKELQASLDRQTATAEVLGVISRSPSETQPVFDAIVATAARLCRAEYALIFKRESDERYHVAATNNTEAGWLRFSTDNPIPLGRGSLVGRTALEGKLVHIPDCLADPEFTFHASQRVYKFRTMLGVPLLHQGSAVGVITLLRNAVEPFSDTEIDLVTTFADQAVIAIENARLFEEVQARTRELSEALEQQTATGEVLNVISRSPSQLQPVLDAIVATAAKLCEAEFAMIHRLEDGRFRLAAVNNVEAEYCKWLAQNPPPTDHRSISGRAITERTTVHIADVLDDPEYKLKRAESLRRGGQRSTLGVPLLRDDVPIGAIALHRTEVRPFTDKQIELVKTFADQAVIAIENTRLFEDVQARTSELQESLEYQTATSAVLNVISRSKRDVQPVFDAIVRRAAELFDPCAATITVREGNQILWRASAAARYADRVEQMARMAFPVPFNPERSPSARAMLERRIIEIPDVSALERNALIPAAREFTRTLQAAGIRSIAFVPLLLTHEGIGTIILGHPEPGFRLTQKQRALVQTFADQAVIAIENARLFGAEQARTRELQEALEYQTATSDVLSIISRSKFDLQPIIDTIVETATRLCQAKRCALMRFEDGGFRLLPTTGAVAGPVTEGLIDRLIPIDRGSVAGRVATERRAVHILDVQADAEYTLMRGTERDDRRTCLGVPLIASNSVLGALVLQRTEVLPFSQEQIKLVETFADQAVIAFENTRLFEEVQARTRELAKTVENLEIASQHKSQFVANMSHELRTPLAAILGYAELMQEGFYEPQGPKSLDALTRIRSNGTHLLGLINTVLDIAKIESGQFTLNMAEYAIESVVETVRSATESLAQNKKLALKTEVAKSLPTGLGDEQRLTQVLLNLVGNAIKFTDTGEVRVTAKGVNGHFNVSVSDTGPGIPEEHKTRIFDQFHQVDSSNSKAKGGTGLGLAIAKQIVEMHGGRIWVESTVGKGSTFQMEIPTRAEFRKHAL